MKRSWVLTFVLLFVGGSHQAGAAGPESRNDKYSSFVPRYLCECLRYCAKPSPQQPCGNYCSRRDDYCPKPHPLICPPDWKYGCDNYCRKPFPGCLPIPLCP